MMGMPFYVLILIVNNHNEKHISTHTTKNMPKLDQSLMALFFSPL